MPDPDVPVPELASRLRAVLGPLMRALRRTDTGLTATEASVFGTIFRHGPLPLRDVAALERLSAPSVSRSVASLEGSGLVERHADATDRRVCHVSVTDAGLRRVEEGKAVRDEWLAVRLRTLDREQRATLAAAVTVLEALVHDDR